MSSSEPPPEDQDAAGSNAGGDSTISNSNDLVIREGFPALLRADGKGGPLIDGEEPLPRYPFASYNNALQISQSKQQNMLLRDCRKVFSARTKEDDAAYSAGCTYFMPCQMKPRCTLEALALTIFNTHTKDLPEGMYNPEQSGAEWWTLVLNASKTTTESQQQNDEKKADEDDGDDDEDGEEGEEDEVGIHFDADYGLEAQVPNMLLHPRVATVTYLSNVGAPTLVLDKKSPPPSDGDEKQSLNGPISKGWLSGPTFGKHVAFDGRLLHGAPALFFPSTQADSPPPKTTDSADKEPAAKRAKIDESDKIFDAQRVAFLVNIWLNHCPLDAELLDDEVVESMETPWDTKGDERSFHWKLSDVSKPDNTTTVTLKPDKDDPAGSDEVVIGNRLVTVEFGPSMKDLHSASSQTTGGKSVELEFYDKSLSLSVGDKVD